MSFDLVSKLVAARVEELMKKDTLFTVSIGGDELYQVYLNAFPSGTNPVYKERTEHDCNCCKNFIRNLGRVIAIENGKPLTVWQTMAEQAHFPYNVVGQALHEAVIGANVEGLYVTNQNTFGSKHAGGWSHFYGVVTKKHQVNQRALSEASVIGAYNSTAAVYQRGLKEITLDAAYQVLELIDSNNLYRGAEFRSAVVDFIQRKGFYDRLSRNERKYYVWESKGAPIRNSAIGTLLVDLSEGKDVDVAVSSFEAKVAPTNYKRPTALITPAMVKKAMQTIEELDLSTALDRRFATFADLCVNDVLWMSGAHKDVTTSSLEEVLMKAAKPRKAASKKAEGMDIEEFVNTVLPKASVVELQIGNNHMSNFVSLTTASDPDAAKLFKWDNPFAWSYNGNVTDSIKEKVKKAGGNVDAKFRVSLAWFNTDDLDLHCEFTSVKGSKRHIYFANKCGILDVDMNASSAGAVKDPVENLSWNRLEDGTYKVYVNQFNLRSVSDVGFDIEVAGEGISHHLSYNKKVSHHCNVDVLKFKVEGGKVVSVNTYDNMIKGSSSFETWGVRTQDFVPVKAVMLSPNCWGEKPIGNKHWFFMMEDVKNPEQARGIYNEFLRSELDKHRKVFELLGDKTKCLRSDEQLSGLGFSETQPNTFVARVDGRLYNVVV